MKEWMKFASVTIFGWFLFFAVSMSSQIAKARLSNSWCNIHVCGLKTDYWPLDDTKDLTNRFPLLAEGWQVIQMTTMPEGSDDLSITLAVGKEC
jgi:hypothetical protein